MEQHYEEATRFTVTRPNPQIMENLIISAIEQRDLHRADILMYSATGAWVAYMDIDKDKKYATMYVCRNAPGCNAFANNILVNTPRVLFPRSCGSGVLTMYEISGAQGSGQTHPIVSQSVATVYVDTVNWRAVSKVEDALAR